MGTNKHQRQEIEDLENLAAIVDIAMNTLQFVALYTRSEHILHEIHRALQALERGRAIIIRRRQQIGGSHE